jgi:hypothetical protein
MKEALLLLLIILVTDMTCYMIAQPEVMAWGNMTGNWQNSGTFIAGAANHKIGGNFSNNGTFNGELSVKRVCYIMTYNAQARGWQPIFETIPAAKHMLFYQYPTTI